jgi:hypothetical protein
MNRRLLACALIPGLFISQIAGAGLETQHRKNTAIEVHSARYDADKGKLSTRIRWNKREFMRAGRDELHLVVYNESDDGAVLRNRTVTASADHPTRKYKVKLSRKQRQVAGDGSHLAVVATHKHDDDGGLYDRAWFHRARVIGAVRSTGFECQKVAAGTTLQGCDLSGANLSGVFMAEAYLPNSDLTLAYLANAVLAGATLSGADLESADLFQADLTGADLTSANLMYSDLLDARLVNANLTNANLTRVVLINTDLTGAIITGATIIPTVICNTTMPDGSNSGSTDPNCSRQAS